MLRPWTWGQQGGTPSIPGIQGEHARSCNLPACSSRVSRGSVSPTLWFTPGSPSPKGQQEVTNARPLNPGSGGGQSHEPRPWIPQGSERGPEPHHRIHSQQGAVPQIPPLDPPRVRKRSQTPPLDPGSAGPCLLNAPPLEPTPTHRDLDHRSARRLHRPVDGTPIASIPRRVAAPTAMTRKEPGESQFGAGSSAPES